MLKLLRGITIGKYLCGRQYWYKDQGSKDDIEAALVDTPFNKGKYNIFHTPRPDIYTNLRFFLYFLIIGSYNKVMDILFMFVL